MHKTGPLRLRPSELIASENADTWDRKRYLCHYTQNKKRAILTLKKETLLHIVACQAYTMYTFALNFICFYLSYRCVTGLGRGQSISPRGRGRGLNFISFYLSYRCVKGLSGTFIRALGRWFSLETPFPWHVTIYYRNKSICLLILHQEGQGNQV